MVKYRHHFTWMQIEDGTNLSDSSPCPRKIWGYPCSRSLLGWFVPSRYVILLHTLICERFRNPGITSPPNQGPGYYKNASFSTIPVFAALIYNWSSFVPSKGTSSGSDPPKPEKQMSNTSFSAKTKHLASAGQGSTRVISKPLKLLPELHELL